MRQLILVRHAKAQAPAEAANDHDRVLTLEGRTSASNLARVLVAAGIAPQRVLVSTALRCAQTWDLMKQAWPEAAVDVEGDIYETHVEGILELIEGVDASVESVMVIGHEPTMSATAAFLAGAGSDTKSLQRVAHGLPTGTAAVLETEQEWSDLGQRDSRLIKVCAANVQF